jgi:hypothetical protein
MAGGFYLIGVLGFYLFWVYLRVFKGFYGFMRVVWLFYLALL